jgi:biofilm PGA synthesis N-glycosyltransferase PgaC
MSDPSITVIVPAYNEADSVADTVRSIQTQSYPATEIIVVDDFSSDATGKIAGDLGVKVLRPPENQGSKAKAQNYALPHVKTDLTVAVDADTVLAPDALEKLAKSFGEADATGACGFVIPQKISTIWERGRLIEYIFVFSFYKPVQDWYEKPLICSGCFSMYDTKKLKANGGYPTRTVTEDLDLTWKLYTKGERIKFVPDAFCYPIEPNTFKILCKQLRRWSHGFHQNIRLHWRNIARIPRLRLMAFAAWTDGIIGALLYLLLLPLLSLYIGPKLLFFTYLSDFLFIAVPVIWKSYKLKMLTTALISLPCFFILRLVTGYHFLKAFIMEFILSNPLKVYEKGH